MIEGEFVNNAAQNPAFKGDGGTGTAASGAGASRPAPAWSWMVCFVVKDVLRRRALNRQPGSGGARREQKPTGYFERFLFVSVSVMDSCLGQMAAL